ncbi:radical SAM/SPASM domain-containing protein [Planctomycetota bacterium]
MDGSDFKIFATGKINKFPQKIDKIFQNRFVEPISTEFHLSQACNHRCPECFGHSEGKDVANTLIEVEEFMRIHDELLEINLGSEEHDKGISFSGSTGDPMVHPDYPEILNYTKLPFIFLTNGGARKIDKSLAKATGLRISLDAVDDDSHLRTHGVKNKFRETCENIRQMVAYKKQYNPEGCSLGLGFLTGDWHPAAKFPDEYSFLEPEMRQAIELGQDLEVDYVQFRPLHNDLHDFAGFREETAKSNYDVRVLFSTKFSYMKHAQIPLRFPTCEANHVLLFIDSGLDVYTCCHLVGLPEACIGNLRGNSLRSILESDHRRRVFGQYPNAKDCPDVCRGHTIIANITAIRQGIGEAGRDGAIEAHDVFL